jgi:outer membrane lipoprotein-sorting protein
MIDKKPESFSDIVDRAAEELQSMPVPPGPPPELLDALLKATSVSDKLLSVASYNLPLSQLQKIRYIIMNNPFKSLTTFAACCLVLIAAYLAIDPMTHGSVAFAEVSAIIQNAKTMVCTVQHEYNPPQPGTGPDKENKIMVLEPGRVRIEGPNLVKILNLPAGKMLTYAPQKKYCSVINIKGMTQEYAQQDLLARLKEIINKPKAEDLGLQILDGKQVKVFCVKEEKCTTIFWAEPKSGDPVKVETQELMPDFSNKYGKGEYELKTVMSNFQFDVPLPESLFSLTPPEGYELQEMNMDVSDAGEKDLIEVLRRCADAQEGVFPPTLAEKYIGPILMREYRTIEVNGATEAERKANLAEIMKKSSAAASLGMKTVLFLDNNKGWKYAGKGVKLGDAQTPIFWYLPKDSKRGRVIYGDLSVRDVPVDQLPPDPDTKKNDTK